VAELAVVYFTIGVLVVLALGAVGFVRGD